ncbi:aquaporin [Thermoleophilia bacterium SCSIO 60948]|nr:aquaporin [Thermoleophilia bacterium SCSIO 60948]
MQDRGLAAYIAELIGTLLLVFGICSAVTLYVSTSAESQTGSDFVLVGLVHALFLFGVIISLGQVSGGHFNPAVTLAAAVMRRIDPIDALVYVLAQLSGAVLGALLVRGILPAPGEASNYGAAAISDILPSSFAGFAVEAIGTFFLVAVICAVAFNPRARQEWAPLAIGTTLGVAAMIAAPLTGAAFNPARWFGPALIGNAFGSFADIWPYVLGPIVGALLAVGVYRFVIAGPQFSEGPEPPTSEVASAERAIKDAEVRARQSG